MGRRSKQTILQRRYTDGQKTHEKMCNITNYYRNSNQNYYEDKKKKTTMRYHLISARMAIIKKSTNNKSWGGHGEKGTLLHC